MMAAVIALLMTSVPVPAFSQMSDMSMKGHGGGYGHMMEEMADMTRMVIMTIIKGIKNDVKNHHVIQAGLAG